MLGQTIGNLLPFALGVALSPIPIVAVVVMLGTPRARTNGPAFAVGWVIGLTAVSIVVLVVAGGAANKDSTTATTVHWGTLVLGLLLLGLAGRKWRGRPRDGGVAELPGWMAAVDSFSAGRSLGMGLLLSAANPKNLALTAAAAAAVAQSGMDAVGETEAIIVFVVLGSVTVVGLVVLFLVGGERAAGVLDSVKSFMVAHNDAIMFVILLLFGAKLVGDGLGGVLG
jgi:threonine/homoserine/homoserine lactone efflux protein